MPPPRKRGHRLLWKWSEVDAKLTEGQSSPDAEASRMREAVRRELEERRKPYVSIFDGPNPPKRRSKPRIAVVATDDEKKD